MKQKGKKAEKSLAVTTEIDKGTLRLKTDFAGAISLLAAAANKKSLQRQLASKK